MAHSTITKLYDTFAEARLVVTDLEAAGIPHSHVSIVANNAEDQEIDKNAKVARDAGIGATAGGILAGGAGLLAGLGIMAIPGVGPVVAAGWLASTLAGAATGVAAGAATGGVIGVLTESGVDHDEAHIYAEGIRRGGALVSVRTDDKWVGLAREILNRRPAVDPALRGQAYRASGWSAFDATTPPYTPAQIEQDRAQFRN